MTDTLHDNHAPLSFVSEHDDTFSSVSVWSGGASRSVFAALLFFWRMTERFDQHISHTRTPWQWDTPTPTYANHGCIPPLQVMSLPCSDFGLHCHISKTTDQCTCPVIGPFLCNPSNAVSQCLGGAN